MWSETLLSETASNQYGRRVARARPMSARQWRAHAQMTYTACSFPLILRPPAREIQNVILHQIKKRHISICRAHRAEHVCRIRLGLSDFVKKIAASERPKIRSNVKSMAIRKALGNAISMS